MLENIEHLVVPAAVAVAFFALGYLAGRRSRRSAGSFTRNKTLRKSVPGGSSASSPGRAGQGGVELYVGNLSYDMTEDQLRKAFEQYGKVDSARVIEHRTNKRSKGFGFVIMPDRAEAMAAIAGLNDREIMGRKMRVNEARGKNRS